MLVNYHTSIRTLFLTQTKDKTPGSGNPRKDAPEYEFEIPSRDQVLALLESLARPVSQREIFATLELKGEPKRQAMRKRLAAMCRDGQLLVNRKGEYCLTARIHLITGTVQGHRDGFGFVIPDDGSDDVFLSARQMREVMHGDRVAVRIKSYDRRGRPEGAVAEVLERVNTQVVGRFVAQGGVGFVVPDNPRITQEILVGPKHRGGAKPGQIVIVEITEPPGPNAYPAGRISRVLGDEDSPGMETEIAVHAHNLPYLWPEEVASEMASFGTRVPSRVEAGRVDLRNTPLVTIDGADARDFDDAVYCEPSGSGWKLLVAIADVSHYVVKGTALDAEARNRGTSVYFPNRVIPMLPEALSNGLCSLMPDVDRLCMVCEMHVDKAGKVSKSRFFRAVMRSTQRFTYEQVAGILQHEDPRLRERFESLLPSLQALYDLYKAFQGARKRRGAIDFDIPENTLEFDERGRVAAIHERVRNDAHKLIEECMIAANVEAARFLRKARIPALYRVHPGPDEDRIEELKLFLAALHIPFNPGSSLKPAMLSEVIKLVQDRPDAALIETVMLRSLAQASYEPGTGGHFGLALGEYAHFTSPIRRYPDLLVHRAIGHLLDGGKPGTYIYSLSDMEGLGAHCSRCERRADDATREAMGWLKTEFMQDKLGQEFPGTVSGVTQFGVFVQLDTLQVDGLVHVSALGSEYFDLDKARYRLVGSQSGRVFQLGDRLQVKAVRASLEDRKIDFELVDKDRDPLRPGKGAGGPGKGAQGRSRRAKQDEGAGQKRRTKAKGKSQPQASPKEKARSKVNASPKPKGRSGKSRGSRKAGS
jgi:ribonuclease R